MSYRPSKKQSELTGIVMFAALVSLGYAGYLYFTVGRANTNEGILTILGGLTLLSVGFTTNVAPTPSRLKSIMAVATFINYAFGIYLFGVIGCAAIGIALSERASWQVFATALLWLVLGWGVLKALADVRNIRRTLLRHSQR